MKFLNENGNNSACIFVCNSLTNGCTERGIELIVTEPVYEAALPDPRVPYKHHLE